MVQTPERARRWMSCLCFACICMVSVGGRAQRLAVSESGHWQAENGFVDAWLSLRRDLDTLDHGELHPRLLHTWLTQMPDHVLHDIMAIATSPTIAYKAAAERVRRGTPKLEPSLQQLSQRYQDNFIQYRIDALRYQVDGAFRRNLQPQLKAPSAAIRMKAAQVMGLAGDRKAQDLLRRQIKYCGMYADAAAGVLAISGEDDDGRFLNSVYPEKCDHPSVLAARGEILLRQRWPLVYEMFLRRDPAFTRMDVSHGMYESWFAMTALLAPDKSMSLASFINSLQRFTAFETLEVSNKRALRDRDAYIHFLQGVVALLQQSDTALWPSAMTDALFYVRGNLKPEQLAPKGVLQGGNDSVSGGLNARVSAAIAILISAGDTLHRSQLPMVSADVHSRTPYGERVLDGNFATRWYARPEAPLVFDFKAATAVSAIYIALDCTEKKTGSISFTVGQDDVQRSSALVSEHRYFQRVALSGKPTSVVSISLDANVPMVCISEVRFE